MTEYYKSENYNLAELCHDLDSMSDLTETLYDGDDELTQDMAICIWLWGELEAWDERT